MSGEHDPPKRGIKPSEFMRSRRPENYSDTEERSAYVLEAAVFEHHLATLTSRNQTHDFEIFCRKLCERAICPNLRPATGPEGGGDSKADTETTPVADELATMWVVGEPSAGSAKWAFAFSAKEDWREKVRSDVKGIAETNRGYSKIIFVTNQAARARTRAEIEDQLTKQYGIAVTVHDRAWIVKEILENDRKDLAYNYLHVGQEIADSFRLGPTDYSRTRQLEELEKSLAVPANFEGMQRQMATEALLAAKLSRSIERPRIETDGRFQRAVRLADSYGTFRQQLEARYEALWTAICWFDDFSTLESEFDGFLTRALESDYVPNLEFASNLLQMLFNAVLHDALTREEAKVDDRAARLFAKLQELADLEDRPNTSLSARVLLVLGRMNIAMLDRDFEAVGRVWPEFADILKKARTLVEFDAQRLINLIEAIGEVAGDDPGFDALVDDIAEFVAQRTSDAEGALVRLKRAEQLDFDRHFELIRLLGRAAPALMKKEYVDAQIRALQLLTLAYKSAGLFWAARSACAVALAAILIDGEEDSEPDATIVPTLALYATIGLLLRHLPDVLHAVQLLNGTVKVLPLDDESQKRMEKRLHDLDLMLASNLANATDDELGRLEAIPDILDGLGLHTARFALLYALGYEAELKAEGTLPPNETPQELAKMVGYLASQPVSDDLRAQLVDRREGEQLLTTIVVGMELRVRFEPTDVSIRVAETALAAIEACFATAIDRDIRAHAEQFEIRVTEEAGRAAPDFDVTDDGVTATIRWPAGLHPGASREDDDSQGFFFRLGLTCVAVTCIAKEDLLAACERLADQDAAAGRVALTVATPNAYQRFFGLPVSRLGDWDKFNPKPYPLRGGRPKIERTEIPLPDDDDAEPEESPSAPTHREFEIHSVINHRLWGETTWNSVVYGSGRSGEPPILALCFLDEGPARKIFGQWRERYGNIDRDEQLHIGVVTAIDPANPAHYAMMIAPRRREPHRASKKGALFASRHLTMHPPTDINLRRFEDSFREVGAYGLMPAIMVDGAPRLITELGILKREIRIVAASDVGPSDSEQMILGVLERRAGETGATSVP